ncbi:hypothetical protein C7C56_012775 [Massilia glaciei]|uniref:Uncharacterized protein n=1 Tax=Massilia glaciei TaxID=1524097 RepID=A0A2U2HLF7_9BURK|nr:hypothetical protein C7C56_012775 [Massilia glaciei]
MRLHYISRRSALLLDPSLEPEQAEQLICSVALGPGSYEWFMVDRAVGNVKSQGPHLAAPLRQPA